MFRRGFSVAPWYLVLNGAKASSSTITVQRTSQELHHLHLEKIPFSLFFSKLHPGENRCLYARPFTPSIFAYFSLSCLYS